ncbi:hypothetical protein SAMN02800687_3644 [Curtobacterium sp. UNCCL20]|uniref:hypothetical protein n=1 Tax=Curtobacterium sp. UNCCL20 TaxID=1502773 RepID=UPI00088B4847|nr:hypothetical protein [Curtobacterium sp. UNCCL20]SDR08206.1 hypothetical protein SAMN02800687_3644 [Curtobacterium sp. UNCCL20]
MKRTIKQVIVTLGVAAVVSPVLVAVPAVAAVESGPSGPSGAIVVDPSFDPANAVRVDDRGEPIGRANQCHDRAFAAIPTMLTSVPGCSIIGSSKNTKITYSWYRDRGKVGVCVWGKGFNSRAQTTWTAAGCGTGRRGVVINWGNVAASKQIRGMTASGAAGVQWG